MQLLFKREQTTEGWKRSPSFKLWGKIELDEMEKQIVAHYRFDKNILIEVEQPDLMRRTIIVGGVVFLLSFGMLLPQQGLQQAMILAPMLGIASGWLYRDKIRETVYVKDLMHGRNFTCRSVVELAKKEAWLANVTAVLRQVMESARHWHGTQTHEIPVLPPLEAKKLIIQVA